MHYNEVSVEFCFKSNLVMQAQIKMDRTVLYAIKSNLHK